MNIGAWMCGVLVIPFAIVGLLFGILKEKAIKFVAGFNSFTDKEQAMYDRVAIPVFIIWCFLFFQFVLGFCL